MPSGAFPFCLVCGAESVVALPRERISTRICRSSGRLLWSDEVVERFRRPRRTPVPEGPPPKARTVQRSFAEPRICPYLLETVLPYTLLLNFLIRSPNNALTCARDPQSRARSALRAADVLAPGHVRGRLPCPARDVTQVLRRRDVRPRAPTTDTQDPRSAAHVYCPAAVCDRAAAGPGCACVISG